MATHPAAASSKSSTATSLRNKNHSGSAVIIQHSITSPAPVTPVIRIKRQNCWWLLGALALIYVIGVHWGVHLAHSSNFVNDDVVSVQDSLQAWSSMWESYVEPMWDSLNGDEDTPSFSSKMYKLVTNSNTNNTTKKKWQPETPRFTAPETLKLPKPIINVGFPKVRRQLCHDWRQITFHLILTLNFRPVLRQFLVSFIAMASKVNIGFVVNHNIILKARNIAI